MPTILTKKSDTPGSIPATANLTNAAGGAELAVNTADKRLFTINSTSQVVELGTNPSSITCADGSFTVARIGSGTVTQLTSTSATITTLTATSATVTNLTATSLVISNLSVASMNITTLTSASATITNLINTSASITTLTNNPTFGAGTANGVLYLNGSKVATSGSALTFDGSALGVASASNNQLVLNAVSASTGTRITISRNGTANTYFGDAKSITGADIDATGLFTTGTNPLIFGIGSEAMRLTSTGLGIGTSSPTHKLQTNGSGRFGTMTTGPGLLSGSSDTFQVGLNQDNTNTTNTQVWAEYVNGATSASWAVRYRTANDTGTASTRLFLDAASGNLGIGTSSPAYKLDVVGAINSSADIISQGNDARISLYRSAGINYFDWASGQSLYFSTQTSAGGGGRSTKMVLTDGGNLGIGTSSPGDRIHAAAATAAGLSLQATGTGGSTWRILSTDNAASLGGGYLGFNNGSYRMVLDGLGNLGIGVTPSAWNTDYRALQIKGGVSLSNDGGNTDLRLSQNVFVNSSAQNIYIATAAATRYRQNAGAHYWDTAASGTAGNTISFTQAMTLTSGSSVDRTNLLVGTTTEIRSAANRGVLVLNGASTVMYAMAVANAEVGYLYHNGTDLNLLNAKNGFLSFSTNDTERARITAGGYSKFSNDGTYTNSAGSYHEFRQSSQTEEGLILRTTNASYGGNSLLVAADRNTTNNSFYAFGYYNFAASAYKLRIADSGDVTNTNGTYGTISDVKMKTDIVDAGSQWADIKGLRFRKFKMKDDPTGLTQLGVVAQEVEQISPGLVDEHADRDAEGNDLGTTTKSVKTSVLLMKAAVALQEAMARIEQLEAKVAALESK